METLSHKFLQALTVPRDALYRQALLRSTSPAGAEAVLQESARAVFREFAGEKVGDVEGAMQKAVGGGENNTGENAETEAMPADVWARLAAAVQVEAALSSHSSALNPDSVLLQPDPMLAPKKAKAREADDFDLASPSRLFMLLGAALLVGILVTIYIVTRPATRGAASRPATSPATGQP